MHILLQVIKHGAEKSPAKILEGNIKTDDDTGLPKACAAYIVILWEESRECTQAGIKMASTEEPGLGFYGD